MERLYRNEDEGIIGGVCYGIAEYFNTDPTIVRLAWVAALFLALPMSAIAYVVALIVIPEKPGETKDWDEDRPPRPSDAGELMLVAEGEQDQRPAADPVPSGAAGPTDGDDRAGRTEPPAKGRRPARGNRGARSFGIILILVGGFFLVRGFVPDFLLSLYWPVLIIVFGLFLLLSAVRGGDQ